MGGALLMGTSLGDSSAAGHEEEEGLIQIADTNGDGSLSYEEVFDTAMEDDGAPDKNDAEAVAAFREQLKGFWKQSDTNEDDVLHHAEVRLLKALFQEKE